MGEMSKDVNGTFEPGGVCPRFKEVWECDETGRDRGEFHSNRAGKRVDIELVHGVMWRIHAGCQ